MPRVRNAALLVVAFAPGPTALFLLVASACSTNLDSVQNGCGNGTIDPGEECDDGNRTSDDGCSMACAVECDTSQPGIFSDPTSKHCYSYIADQKPWDLSESACNAWHGHLVSITTSAEDQYVEDIATRSGQESGVWIGLDDIAVEGKYVWTSGETYSYSNWGTVDAGAPETQPNDKDHSKNCIFFNTKDPKKNYWDDYQCLSDLLEARVCERSPGLPVVP